MKAVQISAYGGAEVLDIKDIPEPTLKHDQLLIEVRAAGLNPFDLKVLSGAYKDMIPLHFPVTFGGDFAGVVIQTGEEVYGSAIALSGGSGAFAERTSAVVEKVAPKPKTVNFVEAAALPVAGLTAVEAILDHIKLQKGQKILIHGGAGGVGHFAIQTAKSVGAYVITTVRGSDREFVKGLGADEVIDFTNRAFEEMVKDVDAVLNCVGAQVTERSCKVIKRGGRMVLLADQANEELTQKYGIAVIRQQTTIDTVHLKRLTDLIDSGKIKVHVDRVFSLNRVKDAFTHLETGHPRGKVVLKIKDEPSIVPTGEQYRATASSNSI